ncbi:MAG: hypothetical protein IKF82_01360 [Bacilli bacterium]|nr:hypothetical protein [Bacilli bacterium]
MQENELEKKDQVEENGASGDIGTPENSIEQTVEAQPAEENVDNSEVANNSEVGDNQEAAENQEVAEEAAEETATEEAEPEKMLTQSQVNELVGKARAEGRASAMKELYGRYGVNDDNEMNDIFGKGQGYDLLNDEYNSLNGNYKNLSAENALLKSGIVDDRWDDVKAILGSKGMEVTAENIAAELVTHPEWKGIAGAAEPAVNKELTPEMMENFKDATKPAQMPESAPAQIRKLGGNAPETKVNTEESDAMKYFGLK